MSIRRKMFSNEMQYLNIVRQILKEKNIQVTRNGNVHQLFGASMRFNLEKHNIPLLTTKKIAWKSCLKELLWFISGKTDNSILQKQNVHIWDKNANNNPDLGPIYGHQWRHFNAPYDTCDDDFSGKGIDQLQNIIDMLMPSPCNQETKLRRSSRRLIMSAWNPCQVDQMALPPCHTLSQFLVTNKNELSCILYQRSGDMGLGIPFNIASYSFLTHLLAHHCFLQPKELIHFVGNAHIYGDHINPLKKQLNREIYVPPNIFINKRRSIIDHYILDDFIIQNYIHHPPIEMIMRL